MTYVLETVDGPMYAAIFRSMLAEFDRDVAEHGERRAAWPLMIGTWKRK
jgi:hypothetical protein